MGSPTKRAASKIIQNKTFLKNTLLYFLTVKNSKGMWAALKNHYKIDDTDHLEEKFFTSKKITIMKLHIQNSALIKYSDGCAHGRWVHNDLRCASYYNTLEKNHFLSNFNIRRYIRWSKLVCYTLHYFCCRYIFTNDCIPFLITTFWSAWIWKYYDLLPLKFCLLINWDFFRDRIQNSAKNGYILT